ncbi:MAG TPA: hypothetical protein VLD65_04075, partial [Anaerolineales bacterium]|nr:hypothetical protein [Anaerolineales bacterium]
MTKHQGKVGSSKEPNPTPGWLAGLENWFKSGSNRNTSQPSVDHKTAKSVRITSNETPVGSRVHFHFELSEGERVRVVAEGIPQAEITAPIHDQAITERDPFDRGLPTEKVTGTTGPVLKSLEATANEISTSVISNSELQPVVNAGTAAVPSDVRQVLDKVAVERIASVPEAIPAISEVVQSIPEKSQSTAIRVILVAASVALALVAPILVFLDRWRATNLASEWLGRLWSSINLFHQLVYPPYFIFVFAAIICIILLIWRVRAIGVDFVIPAPADHQNVPPGYVKLKQKRLGS